MNKTTTQHDLLLYAYNESDLNDSDRIQRRLDGDPLVKQEFNEIIGTVSLLDNLLLEPSEKSMEVIMAFAKKYHA